MSTEKQIRQMVQPLLARHTDLAYLNRRLILKPVTHVFRSVLLDRTAYAHSYEPAYGVQFLSRPNGAQGIGWGGRLHYPIETGWNINKPASTQNFYDVFENDALPQLREITSISDMLAFNRSRGGWGFELKNFPFARAFIDLALGKFDAAEEALAEIQHSYDLSVENDKNLLKGFDPDAPFYLKQLNILKPLVLSNDKKFVAQALHRFEEDSVKAHKIEHLWERTPFPLELD